LVRVIVGGPGKARRSANIDYRSIAAAASGVSTVTVLDCSVVACIRSGFTIERKNSSGQALKASNRHEV